MPAIFTSRKTRSGRNSSICGERLAAAAGDADLVPLVLEELPQHPADAFFVVYDQYPSHTFVLHLLS